MGLNPTDRGKAGTKRHLVTDANGIPLAARPAPANRHDSIAFEELGDAVPPTSCPSAQRRKRPARLHADNAYGIPRRAPTRRRIKVRIARRGVESSERPGRHRWVVERTLAWLSCYRRLSVRYERREDIHQAFLSLACALICWNFPHPE